MSSPPPFLSSSHSAFGNRRRKSRFTYKHLSQLANYAPTSPLRVIALIDLDAFYAQCESIRLGLPEDQPLAVQQWGGLIAISYPAKAAGCTRFIDMQEAKKLCPNIVFQHVATWKEGEAKWAYRDDSALNVGSQKVSLDPYRKLSQEIFACIREFLPPAPLQKVEKASVDEVFLDLSAHVRSILMDRYPELSGPPPYDDPTENLPLPPTTALDWKADALVDLDMGETEDDDPDWDDVAMLVGSEIVRDVRAAIREKLKFTCSGGVSRNKMLAKLGAGHKKPNQQTVIRNRAVQQFLNGYKFTKIRNLGGKLGDQVAAAFGTDEVGELLEVSLEQLKSKLDDDAGSWVYKVIRGDDHSEVNARTQIKSMLSAKSFRPYINDQESAIRWLRIFVADIFTRLVEEGVVENKRRPKTINLHHRQGGVTRSRQLPIPSGRRITEDALFELSKTLLSQVIIDGRVWPCSNLSLSVGGFENGVTGNHGIGAFLVKGDEAKAMNASKHVDIRSREDPEPDAHPPRKRRRTDDGIQKFLAKPQSGKEDQAASPASRSGTPTLEPNSETERLFVDDFPGAPDNAESPAFYGCSKCQAQIHLADKPEHDDWHFAKDLEANKRGPDSAPPEPPEHSKRPIPVKSHRGRPRKTGGVGVGDRGQTKLAFGR